MTTHVRLQPGQATDIEQAGGAWLQTPTGWRWVPLVTDTSDAGHASPPRLDAPRIDARTSQ